MSDAQFDAALDLLRRLNPTTLQENLNNLIELQPNLAQDLLSSVDVPLSTQKDSADSNREYLCCDYNRDIDSFRSPWSNTYYPELSPKDLQDSPFPSAPLRKLEILANDSFDVYRDLYYEGGISSVYLWDLNEEDFNGHDFAGVVLFKKTNQITVIGTVSMFLKLQHLLLLPTVSTIESPLQSFCTWTKQKLTRILI